MKTVTIIVDSCGHCPFYDGGKCKFLKRQMNAFELPADCPLEDEK